MTRMSSPYAITARQELQNTTSEEKSMAISNEKLTVLLVDDDDDFLYQHRLQLEGAGFNVIAARGQKPAEEILGRLRPDVAVVDVMMENPDAGFVLCHHIRKKDPSIPVILVTSVNSETGMDFDLATEEDRVWIKADALLAKPIRFEQLLGEIDRLLAVKK
jgi:CheY-like chemotaxis protein